VTSPIFSEHEQLARLVIDTAARTEALILGVRVEITDTAAHMEALIMATKAQVEQAQAEQSAAFTDFADDVTAKLSDLTAKLDAALAAETADAAALADMKALTDDVVTKTNAFTEAIKAADVSVDRPTA
jgi:iron uptake system EfeUOB component EfeO/EfeM